MPILFLPRASTGNTCDKGRPDPKVAKTLEATVHLLQQGDLPQSYWAISQHTYWISLPTKDLLLGVSDLLEPVHMRSGCPSLETKLLSDRLSILGPPFLGPDLSRVGLRAVVPFLPLLQI